MCKGWVISSLLDHCREDELLWYVKMLRFLHICINCWKFHCRSASRCNRLPSKACLLLVWLRALKTAMISPSHWRLETELYLSWLLLFVVKSQSSLVLVLSINHLLQQYLFHVPTFCLLLGVLTSWVGPPRHQVLLVAHRSAMNSSPTEQEGGVVWENNARI